MKAGAKRAAPLRHLGFRLLIIGELVSNVGDAIYSIALPWYVLSHHGGTVLLGTVLAAYGVPRAALLLAGGRASDRLRPWTVMLGANAIRGIGAAVFAVIAFAGITQASVLIAIAVVLGAGEGIFLPASSAIVPALVETDELQAGNALSFGATQFSQLTGPAVGGVLVAFAGSATGFAIDAATFIVSAVTLVGIRRHAPTAAPSAEYSPPAGSAENLWELLIHEPFCRVIFVTDVLLNLGSAGMSRVALPALAHGPLHLGATGYGALSAAMGGGLLLGTIAGVRLPPTARPLLGSSLLLLPTVPLIAAVPYAGGWIPAALLLIVAFVLVSISNLLLITGVQQWAPPHLLGRITAALMLPSVGIVPVSVLLAGVIVHLTGPALFFPLEAASLLLAVSIELSSPHWRAFRPGRPQAV